VCAFLFEQSKKKFSFGVGAFAMEPKIANKKKKEICGFFFYKLKIGDFPIKWGNIKSGGRKFEKIKKK